MRLTWGRFTKGSIYAIVDRMTLTFDLLTWKWFVTHGSLMGCISCTYAANPSSNRRAMAQTWWWWKGVVFNCFITYCSYQNNVRVNWSPSQINILYSTLTGGRGGGSFHHWVKILYHTGHRVCKFESNHTKKYVKTSNRCSYKRIICIITT